MRNICPFISSQNLNLIALTLLLFVHGVSIPGIGEQIWGGWKELIYILLKTKNLGPNSSTSLDF